jgi:hypothetical protein
MKQNSTNTFRVTEQTSYQQAKLVAAETSTKNYKKSKEDAIKKFRVHTFIIQRMYMDYYFLF